MDLCFASRSTEHGTLWVGASSKGVLSVSLSAPAETHGSSELAELGADVVAQLLIGKNPPQASLEGLQFGSRFVPIDLWATGTRFEREVWAAACAIPWGRTKSYSELARELGRPKASRAVGAALGKNPVPILIPCHRVIAARGALTGYALGLPLKRVLLAVEAESTGLPLAS